MQALSLQQQVRHRSVDTAVDQAWINASCTSATLRPSLTSRARNTSPMPPGLLLTVMCAEWYPNSGGMAQLKAKAAQKTWVRASALDLPSACSSVPVKPISAALRKPVTSKVKTLLLSGEIDIRTPASMGTHVAKTLPNSVHVVIPYASHSTISSSCAVSLITAFFDTDGDVKKLDTSCTKSVAHPGW